MPRIYTNKTALDFWEANQGNNARSLAATRYLYLASDEDDNEWRKKSCKQIAKTTSLGAKSVFWNNFLDNLPAKSSRTLFAKLEAHLLINLGGGVIENGNISLDRNSGIPLIPGSAIKAAARRQALHELSETLDPITAAQLLSAIALTFGYGDTDWKAGRNHKTRQSNSDFWLAMVPLFEAGEEQDATRDERWKTISEDAAKHIFNTLSPQSTDKDKLLAAQLPSLAGCLSFLPAMPVGNAAIVTDVLTPHHQKYYGSDNEDQDSATDDENPIPIFFPAVSKGTTYRFTVTHTAMPNSSDSLSLASTWLLAALTTLGIGAKTNAGYGWFSPDENATVSHEKLQSIRQISREFANFNDMTVIEKENLILRLAEESDLCHDWNKHNPSQFKRIEEYASEEGFILL